MSAAVIVQSPPAVSAAPVRVMVVDDSVVVRGHIRHWIEQEPGLELVASLSGGREAVEKVAKAEPDVVVLDIEMPGLDGISALPLLLEKCPDLAIIIASTLTRRNAEITLKALALGALDCIPKPDANMPDAVANFRRDLMAKVRELGARRRMKRAPALPPSPAGERSLVRSRGRITPPLTALSTVPPSRPIALRVFTRISPRVLIVGASTGGPQALITLMSGLGSVSERAPILITQHMPPMFTTILAEHIVRSTGCPAREAIDGEPVLAGRVYLAPGGRHMSVTRRDGTAVIALDDGAPIHHCKPAVDRLFSSAAAVWGSWVLGVILTGMGTDGRDGAGAIVNAGGSIIAQDEATSVVWGMPGAAAESGLCSAVLALDSIAPKVTQLFAGDRS